MSERTCKTCPWAYIYPEAWCGEHPDRCPQLDCVLESSSQLTADDVLRIVSDATKRASRGAGL
jgi:hypothetical protein